MKLGIFGDSFADTGHMKRDNNDSYTDAWPRIVDSMLDTKTTEFFSLSGTSMWWSYQNFIQNHDSFDTIVFVYTTETRWPNLPEEEDPGEQYNVGYSKSSDFLNYVNRYYFDLFPRDLTHFIGKNIFKDVNEICEKKNIDLINIIVYQEEYYSLVKTPYPIIYDLDTIARREVAVVDGKEVDFYDFIEKNNNIDMRFCHLNASNNRHLANLVSRLIKEKSRDVIISAPELDVWDYRCEKIAGYYK